MFNSPERLFTEKRCLFFRQAIPDILFIVVKKNSRVRIVEAPQRLLILFRNRSSCRQNPGLRHNGFNFRSYTTTSGCGTSAERVEIAFKYTSYRLDGKFLEYMCNVVRGIFFRLVTASLFHDFLSDVPCRLDLPKVIQEVFSGD